MSGKATAAAATTNEEVSKGVSKQQIADWKAKHKDVYAITVEDKTGYVRKPTRNELSFAMQQGQKSPLKFNECILLNCWLGGDDEIKTNDDYFLAAGAQLSEIVQVKEAEIKKL